MKYYKKLISLSLTYLRNEEEGTARDITVCCLTLRMMTSIGIFIYFICVNANIIYYLITLTVDRIPEDLTSLTPIT